MYNSRARRVLNRLRSAWGGNGLSGTGDGSERGFVVRKSDKTREDNRSRIYINRDRSY